MIWTEDSESERWIALEEGIESFLIHQSLDDNDIDILVDELEEAITYMEDLLFEAKIQNAIRMMRGSDDDNTGRIATIKNRLKGLNFIRQKIDSL